MHQVGIGEKLANPLMQRVKDKEMKIVEKTITIIISLILIFLLIYSYKLKRNNENIKKEIAVLESQINNNDNVNTELTVLKNKKQEMAMLLIRSNEDLNKLRDENFELKLFKKELDQINNNENYSQYKNELKKYINKNINDLISIKPTQGGSWIVTKIIFINPFELIVYCEDGHESMESNLGITLLGNKIKIMEK